MLFSPPLLILVTGIGILIGSIGIGGVLLVPTLAYLGGIPIHTAIPACTFSYLITGAVGAFIYANRGSINWKPALKVCLGALPGAYLGAFLLPWVPATVLEPGIAGLMLFSGLYSFSSNAGRPGLPSAVRHTPRALPLIGFVTGVGSALSGTGGPLLLVPILIWCKVAILTAIGLAQIIQIPIALLATLGNRIHGEVDFQLGLGLSVMLAVGALVGAKTAHIVPAVYLKNIVAVVLIAVGLLMLLKAAGQI